MRKTVRGVSAALVIGVLAASSDVGARPVRIGRFAELPFGVSDAHPNPTDGGGPSRTARVRGRVPGTAPEMKWEVQLRAALATTPAVLDDGTVLLSGTGGVGAVRAGGQLAWSARVGAASGTPSVTPDGSIVVGTHSGEIVVLSRAGEVVAEVPVGTAVSGSPLVLEDGSIVVSAFDQAVHRFDADGRRIFRTALPYQVEGHPALAVDGAILVPAGGVLYFVSADGTVRREVALGHSILAGPAVADDGTVWAIAGEREREATVAAVTTPRTASAVLFAVEPAGRIRSRTTIAEELGAVASIAVGRDGAIRVATVENVLLCVGPTGTERWRATTRGGIVSAMSIDESDAVLAIEAGQEHSLLAIDARGRVMWRVELASRARAAPVLGTDGTVYVATGAGALMAFAPSR